MPESDEQVPSGESERARLRQRRAYAVTADHFRVIAQPGPLFARTRAALRRQGWSVKETPHFLLAQATPGASFLLVHRFSAEEIDNNVVDYLLQELAVEGPLSSERDFQAAFEGLVVSLFPIDPLAAWGRFAFNTFVGLRERLEVLESTETGHPGVAADTMTTFATIYQRLFALIAGTSLLDVGCACAFWPLFVAERRLCPAGQIVASDQRADALQLSALLASLVGIEGLRFRQADVLQPAFADLGSFGTVSAIHVLEHLEEEQLPLALRHLLQVTQQRLLIVVPFEREAQAFYGHRQTFSAEKLCYWGAWCVEQLGGAADYWYEDLLGGLLVVERHPKGI
jgi:SAM-dependent methyltransferase